jgi:hypothetical protein
MTIRALIASVHWQKASASAGVFVLSAVVGRHAVAYAVTAMERPDRTNESRNTRLKAEIERIAAREIAEPQSDLDVAFNGKLPDEQRQAKAVARWIEDVGFSCVTCGHEFDTGEVAYLKRRARTDALGISYDLRLYCRDCVSKWHPSWLENAREPRPCAGECGLLISGWAGWRELVYRHCSPHCREEARRARRRRATTVNCEVCGREFQQRRADARYCSGACRQRAYRERAREQATTTLQTPPPAA